MRRILAIALVLALPLLGQAAEAGGRDKACNGRGGPAYCNSARPYFSADGPRWRGRGDQDDDTQRSRGRGGQDDGAPRWRGGRDNQDNDASHWRRRGDQDRARDASRSGEVLPLESILRGVRQRYGGRLLDADLVRGGNGYVYLIKIIDDSNRVRILQVDARTGRVLGAR